MNISKKWAKPALILVMVSFGTVGLLRRQIPLSAGFISMARGLLGAGYIFICGLITGKPVRLSDLGKKLPWLALTGAVMGLGWISFFEAYNYTSIATATLCYYLAPTLITLAAPLVLKEKLTVKSILCACVTLCGMVLVSGVLNTSTTGQDLIGVAFSLGAAVLNALVVLANKKINCEDAMGSSAIQLLSAAAVPMIYVLLTENVLQAEYTLRGLLALAAIGIVITGFLHVLYISAICKVPAQTVALFSYLDPVVAVLCSALILQEPMGITHIIGAVLIIGGAVAGEWKGKEKP